VTRIFIIALTSILLGTTHPGSAWQAASPFTSASVAPYAEAQAARTTPAPLASALPNEQGSVKFGVIGDTGTGGSAQLAIARLLADARMRFPYEFVIMLGDNMYGGESPSDFVKKFERPYKPILDAGIKFYASLGNHDEPAQRFYKPFNMDGDRYYTFKKGDVEFFVLDSTQLNPPQLAWLKDVLGKSNAKWKIPYFHHPLYSSGDKHGSEEDLRVILEPLFIEHGVDVVFAGHEHFYERVKPQKGIHYFTAGGSAKLRKNNIRKNSPLTAKGFDTDNSFMLIEVAGDRLHFETISRKGAIVDTGTILHRSVEERAREESTVSSVR
jgi:predicted phosphodiesterase